MPWPANSDEFFNKPLTVYPMTNPKTPAPALDEERKDLAHLLVNDAECLEAEQPDLMAMTNHQMRRAATLIRQPAPAVVPVARPADEWHEDIGDVLWWRFPVEEAPYCGRPDDMNWPLYSPGYFTHFTPLAIPQPPHGGEVES